MEVSIGTIIAVNGKGGTGKTTIASLLVGHLISNEAGSVLAIDADPNSCFAESLGINEPPTIVGICEGVSKNLGRLPAGVTKDRHIEMRVQDAVVEDNGFDVLVMGHPEGPGCYCYVNNLLRGLIEKIIKNYDFVVIDNAAGMEHISRRTAAEITKLILVSDYSAIGVRSALRIYGLAKEVGIKIGGAYLIINKVSGSLEPLEKDVLDSGLEVIGSVPYDEALVSWSISNKPIFAFESKPVMDEIGRIFRNLTRIDYADRTG
jgi:CO dehydrogenase maturation factor